MQPTMRYAASPSRRSADRQSPAVQRLARLDQKAVERIAGRFGIARRKGLGKPGPMAIDRRSGEKRKLTVKNSYIT